MRTTTNSQWGTTTAASLTSTTSTTTAIKIIIISCNYHSQQQLQHQQSLSEPWSITATPTYTQQQSQQYLQQRPLQDNNTNAGTVPNEKRNIAVFGDVLPKCITGKINL